MVSKKAKQKIMKHKICTVARAIACTSFLILTIIGVSSLVRAMSLENIANENGVPASWETASLGNPDTITVPITYWDQRQDDCNDPNRQFEWVICNYWTAGALQGIVKDHLGSDGLPIPTYTNSTDSWNTNYDVFSQNVTGQDPVQPTDNFYRWFHDTSVSQHYDRQITFTRTGKNTYTYGETNIFPMDNVDFSNGDSAWRTNGHNYHFTAHLNFATKIAADGSELFEFSGDDDVWVFLNGKLVLDIGGLHEKLNGWFRINTDGTISTYVQNVNDPAPRASLGEPSNDFNSYVGPFNDLIRTTFQDKYETIDAGIKPGDVVNLDFFYAERSTTESNTKITISNMNWPISADSNIDAEIVGKLPDNNSNLVKYNTSITNRDPDHPLDLERFAAYVTEDATDSNNNDISTSGFLPLDETTLYYSATPADESSWQPVQISAPANSASGFNLATPIRMSPNGQPGDTLYFRYFGETSEHSGTMTSLVSYYTTMDGEAGVTYDYATVEYVSPPVVEDEKHTVTIKYLYEDNSEAAPTYTGTFAPNEEFSIDSPEVPEYKADFDFIKDIMQDHDLEYTVYYKKPAPESPTTPVEPTQPDPTPETPSNPTPVVPMPPSIPNIPRSDIIGGNLLYLAPLGQIAYVPNTGIIGDAAASVFEEGFAEIILSQAMVMIMLAIFAGSFSVYFSLRQFIKFQPATATTTAKSSRAQKSSAKTRKKSYAKMTKATAKSTKAKTTKKK